MILTSTLDDVVFVCCEFKIMYLHSVGYRFFIFIIYLSLLRIYLGFDLYSLNLLERELFQLENSILFLLHKVSSNTF